MKAVRLIEVQRPLQQQNIAMPLIGENDVLVRELPLLLELARRGKLKLSEAITHTVPLDCRCHQPGNGQSRKLQ